MRAAFLFSGQLRGFPYCVDAFNEFLFSAFEEYDTFFYMPNIDGKNLLNCFNPTSVIFEKDQLHPELPNFQHNIGYSDEKLVANNYPLLGRMQHYYLQWYGVKRVFDLFEQYKNVNDINYDVVFRIRTDILFYKKFNYIPFNGIQIPDMCGHGGIYDRLAFGSFEHMKYYCSLYDKIFSGHYKDMLYAGNSESKLRQHIESQNIPLRSVEMGFYHSINADGSYIK